MEHNPGRQERTGWRSRHRRKPRRISFGMNTTQGDDWFSRLKLYDFSRTLSFHNFLHNEAPSNPGNPLNSLILANSHPHQELSFYRVS